MKRYQNLLLILLVAIITFAAYLPSLKNGFTHWDDYALVVENEKIQSITAENLKDIFTKPYRYLYHPLVLVSYAIEYKFFGPNPHVYHFTNLLLHILSSILVFWFAYIICRKKVVAAFLIAVLFGVHPMHVESVAWISERKDVLYAAFFMGSLIAYLKYLESRSLKLYSLSIIMFVCSMLSKPMAVTLPLILLLIDYFYGRKFDWRLIGEKILFFLIALLFGIITIAYHYEPGLISRETNYSFLQKIFIASYGIAFYIYKAILPLRLSCLYPALENLGYYLPLSYIFSVFIAAILAGVVFFTRRYTKKVIFGSLFFLITISPVIQLISAGLGGVHADRYTYIPFVGLFYLAGEGVCWINNRLGTRAEKKSKIVFWGLLSAILIFFAVLTFQRCGVWKDNLTLWNDALSKYTNIPVGYNNRAATYNERLEHDKAIKDCDMALRLNPLYVEALINRGTAYARKGDLQKAILDYNRGLSINPFVSELYNNRGNAFIALKRYDNALENLNRAAALNPGNPRILNNIGYVYSLKGDYGKAFAAFDKALRMDQGIADIYLNRGIAYFSVQEYGKAAADFGSALRLEPANFKAYNNRGAVYYTIGDYDKAIYDFDRAFKLNPNYGEAYKNRQAAIKRREEAAGSQGAGADSYVIRK